LEEEEMNHKGTVLLETERLYLRKFEIGDAGAMYSNWASEDEVTKFLTWPTHTDIAITREVLNCWITNYQRADFYNWAIELKELGEVVGNISVVCIKEPVASAELGYCIGTKWWGQGLMPEAGREVIRYLFEEAGFNRVAAAHAKDNRKSGRVMRKIGMVCEGTLRASGKCNQGVVDEVWYSILRNEYQSRRG